MTWTQERRMNVVYKMIIFLLLGTVHVTLEHTSKDVLNILLWTSSLKKPFDMLEIGFTPFINRVCAYQNCFFTKKDNSTLSNVTNYDAIIFNAVNLQSDTREALFPKFRNPEQSYILFSIESPSLYPLHRDFEGAFNLTWTYKLNSNITIPYLSVVNNLGTRIAPNIDVDWIKYNDMKHTKKYLKRKLERKIIAAAWIVSNCLAKNRRLEFVRELQQELTKYNLSIDIFGRCGNMECKTYDLDECYAAIETDYFFYLAFENSCHDDYVTEKVLHGLRHYTVPIVYGGANYSRFLPPNIYLNALELGVQKLAKTMNDIIHNKSTYYEYFKWHEYYYVFDTFELMYKDEICELCSVLNHVRTNNSKSVFPYIVNWWNEDNENSADAYRHEYDC